MAYYYHVKVESTGSFRVKAESEEDARGLVLDHMHEAGTPFKPGVDILVLADGHDKVLSISQFMHAEELRGLINVEST